MGGMLIDSDSDHERFLVAVHLIKEGPPFLLWDIKFTGRTAIPEAELRQVISLREGEFFDVARARMSFEALTKLCGSHRYIDFTTWPETQVDDNFQRISLVLHLNEQTQYRVGSLEIRGFVPSLETNLRSTVVPGEVFNPQPIETFFKENRPVLPSRGLDNFQIRRDRRTGIVDLTFDLQFCP
jgi:outer membrane protein assembly factor BamA